MERWWRCKDMDTNEIIWEAFRLYPISISQNLLDSRFPVDLNRKERLKWIEEQKSKQ